MRKVLLRIVFDHAWQLQSKANELHVGYGWVISVWLLIAVISMWVLWKISKDTQQVFSSLLFWALIPTLLLVVPLLNLPLAGTGIPVFGYGFMLFVGFTTATWLAGRRARQVGLNPDIVWDLIAWLLIPGIAGARIVYLLQYGDQVFAGKHGFALFKAAIALWDGGIVFYGSIIGGVIGMLIFCRRRGIRPLLLGDVLIPSLFVGLGFGRIGCFLYGCCFGAACSLPWAVQFPADSLTFERLAQRSEQMLQQGKPDDARLLMADGKPITVKELSDLPEGTVVTTIALHPTQLYSSFLAFCLAGLLSWFFRHRPFDGSVLALGWTLYPINRFILEIIRDDEPGRLNTGLTFSQLVSLGLFISGLLLMLWLSIQNRRHQQSAA